MKATVGYQYYDSDPEEIQKKETQIDLDQAVELFSSFPWDEQFAGILKRKESDLSSTSPTLYFFETENRFLSISATDDEGFVVHYREGDRLGELFISNNILEKPEGISVEQFIDDFFNDKVEETLELIEFELEPTKEIRYELDYKKSKLYRPLLFMLIPLIYIFFDSYDPALVLPFILSMSGIIFLFTLPNLLLNFSYWKNDSNQSITYNPTKKLLTIQQNNENYEIPKSEIESVELVHTRLSQRAFQEYSYLRFKSGDSAFALTHLTIDPVEILSTLNINFRDIEVFYPNLSLNAETEKEKQERQNYFEQKREEFQQTYSNWETEKLEEVVSRTDHYADYAISAANEILTKRKSS
jgi:hypothetical protein